MPVSPVKWRGEAFFRGPAERPTEWESCQYGKSLIYINMRVGLVLLIMPPYTAPSILCVPYLGTVLWPRDTIPTWARDRAPPFLPRGHHCPGDSRRWPRPPTLSWRASYCSSPPPPAPSALPHQPAHISCTIPVPTYLRRNCYIEASACGEKKYFGTEKKKKATEAKENKKRLNETGTLRKERQAVYVVFPKNARCL